MSLTDRRIKELRVLGLELGSKIKNGQPSVAITEVSKLLSLKVGLLELMQTVNLKIESLIDKVDELVIRPLKEAKEEIQDG